MPEIGELVKVNAHTEDNPYCPFCKKDDDEYKYKTYAGSKNDSGVLASNLRSGKAGNSEKDQNCRFTEQIKRPKPNFVIKSPKGQVTMSFQAHHAISGNQAMKGEEIEKWIDKDKGKIAAHTGYSINNPTNGIWLPSKPEKIKWGSISTITLKRQFAYYAMKKRNAQWHLGHHRIVTTTAELNQLKEDDECIEIIGQVRNNELPNFQIVVNEESAEFDTISDDDHDDADDSPAEKGTYDAWLKEQLKLIDQHISKCQPKCENQKDSSNGKPYVNKVINVMLDNLSNTTRRKLSMSIKWREWNRFISRLAWEYTKLNDDLAPAARRGRRAGNDG